MGTGWTHDEAAQIDAAIQAGLLVKAEPPPPLPDPDILARQFAEKPVSPRAFGSDIPEQTVKLIKDMAGLYSREAIADRAEVTIDVVRRILGPIPGKRRKVTEQMKRTIIEARGKESLVSLATRLGIGQMSICRVFKKAGLIQSGKRLRTGQIVTPEIRQQIIEARGTASLPEIAAHFGISRSFVSQIYRQAGISGTPTTGRKLRRRRSDEIRPDEEATFLALRGKLAVKAIAERFKRHPASIRRVFRRADEDRAEAVAAVRSRTPRNCPLDAAASSGGSVTAGEAASPALPRFPSQPDGKFKGPVRHQLDVPPDPAVLDVLNSCLADPVQAG